MNTAPALDRFTAKYTTNKVTGCWEWTAYRNEHGYGKFGLQYAHRFSFEHHVGPIPDGLVLDHLCRNPPCVNPSHLEAVTIHENLCRGIKYNAAGLCRSCGEPYDRVRVKKNGYLHRGCRACNNITRRKYDAKIRRERAKSSL